MMADDHSEEERLASAQVWATDDWFTFFCWGMGGALPALLGALLFTSLLERASDTAVQSDFKEFIVISLVYSIASVVMMFVSRTRGRTFLLPVGGIVSIVYLFFAVRSSGGLHLSPLSFTFFYLPAVVTWYLSNGRGPFMYQVVGYCGLCFGAYIYLLNTASYDGPTAHWLMFEGVQYWAYKWFKAVVLGTELLAVIFFGIREQSARSEVVSDKSGNR